MSDYAMEQRHAEYMLNRKYAEQPEPAPLPPVAPNVGRRIAELVGEIEASVREGVGGHGARVELRAMGVPV